jgi:hypothetical protein
LNQRIQRGREVEQLRADLAAGRAEPTLDNLQRAEGAIQYEGSVPDDARLWFECSGPDDDRCDLPPISTEPALDARVFTELPRKGAGTKPYATRVALRTRRLASESINALMTHRGMAGRGPERKAKGTDAQVDWLMSLGLLWMTARALVHADGSYAATAADMHAHGLINGCDSDTDLVFDDLLRRKVRRVLSPDNARPPRGLEAVGMPEGYNREERPYGDGRRRDVRAQFAA